jgi:hypothetical protein
VGPTVPLQADDYTPICEQLLRWSRTRRQPLMKWSPVRPLATKQRFQSHACERLIWSGAQQGSDPNMGKHGSPAEPSPTWPSTSGFHITARDASHRQLDESSTITGRSLLQGLVYFRLCIRSENFIKSLSNLSKPPKSSLVTSNASPTRSMYALMCDTDLAQIRLKFHNTAAPIFSPSFHQRITTAGS